MRLLTTILALIGGLFSILAYSRARLPYNEEGRYYDATAGVVYDTDAVTAYTQTVGVYPESLKKQLRDELPLYGAQRLTSLGYACNVATATLQPLTFLHPSTCIAVAKANFIGSRWLTRKNF